jgi:hypothetical protein
MLVNMSVPRPLRGLSVFSDNIKSIYGTVQDKITHNKANQTKSLIRLEQSSRVRHGIPNLTSPRDRNLRFVSHLREDFVRRPHVLGRVKSPLDGTNS